LSPHLSFVAAAFFARLVLAGLVMDPNN
jgi:hypothetical protein